MNVARSTLSPAPPLTVPAPLWDRPPLPGEGAAPEPEWSNLPDGDGAPDPEWPLGQLLYPDYVPEYDDALSPDDPEYYPCHPEIAVVESEQHARLLNFILDVLVRLLRGRGVFTRLAVHWARGKRGVFGAPDLMVTAALPAREKITSYVVFLDPPIQCVVEVVSQGNEQKDLDKKFHDYQDVLKVPEYLLVDPTQETLVLYRMGVSGGYAVVAADAQGRVWSEQCRVWYGWEPAGSLRMWDERGVEQQDYTETYARAEAEHARAETEHARAGRLAARLRALGLDPEA